MSDKYKKRGMLMLVENHYPEDIRVRKEAQALKPWFNITVLAVKRRNQPMMENVDGVNVLRIPPMPSLPLGKFQYGLDYAYITIAALFLFLLLMPVKRFKVVHAHNPPDTFFLVGLLIKLFGGKFVFDHHDLSPELYLTRFGGRQDLIYRTLLLLEKFNCRLADMQIATNSSYKNLAVKRHGVDPEKVFVVRNDPSSDEFRLDINQNEKRVDHNQLVFLGMVNPQDGVDILCEVMKILVVDMGRADIVCHVLGHGDSLGDVERLAEKLGVGENMIFHGFVRDRAEIVRLLGASQLGVEPAPDNPLNRHSTFIKIMEYMSAGIPVVAFDLTETRYSLGDAGILIEPGNQREFAQSILDLLENEARRNELSRQALARIRNELNWDRAVENLIAGYKTLFDSESLGIKSLSERE